MFVVVLSDPSLGRMVPGGVSVVKELQPGDPSAIGPYRLIGRLGEGGMGRVFLGLSPGGRPVAVKAVRAELAADPEFLMRFGREVAAARRVSGVFTAPVVDADIDGPMAWLATAYVPGPSLAEAVDRHGPLPEGSVLALAAGLAESLTAIHAAGVMHQDLKPSNVLLAEDGPRVIDFGISGAAESTPLTRAGPVIGSPGFMSPEQAMGGEVGPPSDIFSLGALLAFAATGQGPFGTGTTAALLYRVVHETPSLDQLPTAVRSIVEHCLAKDPRQRPTASGLLAEVGRLQPTANWLPDSLSRTFAQDARSGSVFARSGSVFAGSGSVFAAPATAFAGSGSAVATPATAFAGSGPAVAAPATAFAGSGPAVAAPGTALGPDVAPWPGEAATQVMAVSAVMGAAYSPTATSRSLPPPPPPGDARRQSPPPPPRRNRPRLRLGRPLVLACVIGALLVTGAFTLTSVSGNTPSPAQSRTAAAPAPAPTVRTSTRRTASRVSASPSASRRVTYQVIAPSAAGITGPASASPTASKKPSPTPTASKKPSPTPTASKKPSPSPSPTRSKKPSPSPSPSPSTTPSTTPTTTTTPTP